MLINKIWRQKSQGWIHPLYIFKVQSSVGEEHCKPPNEFMYFSGAIFKADVFTQGGQTFYFLKTF